MAASSLTTLGCSKELQESLPAPLSLKGAQLHAGAGLLDARALAQATYGNILCICEYGFFGSCSFASGPGTPVAYHAINQVRSAAAALVARPRSKLYGLGLLACAVEFICTSSFSTPLESKICWVSRDPVAFDLGKLVIGNQTRAM